MEENDARRICGFSIKSIQDMVASSDLASHQTVQLEYLGHGRLSEFNSKGRLIETIMHRHITITTQQRNSGFTSKGVHPGDPITTSLGSRTPCILRPASTSTKNPVPKLVSSSVVHGLMHGETRMYLVL